MQMNPKIWHCFLNNIHARKVEDKAAMIYAAPTRSNDGSKMINDMTIRRTCITMLVA